MNKAYQPQPKDKVNVGWAKEQVATCPTKASNQNNISLRILGIARIIQSETLHSSRLNIGYVVPPLPNLHLKFFKNQQGITYIEIMVVVVILSIIAAVAMPNLSSNDHRKLDIAAAETIEAIRFARLESIRTASPHGVKFDSNNDTVKVYSLVYSEYFGFPIWTLTFDVYHPIDKKLYTLNLKSDTKTSGVNLQSYSIYYGSSGTSSEYIGFNSHGNPKSANGSTDEMLNGTGSITLAYVGQTRVISIAPMTGRVTVQ